MDRETERAIADIRALRVLEWKRKYCIKHKLYKNGNKQELDFRMAPQPKDADIGFPIETLTVRWGEVGYLVIELSALQKLPAKQRNAILKLGGLNK